MLTKYGVVLKNSDGTFTTEFVSTTSSIAAEIIAKKLHDTSTVFMTRVLGPELPDNVIYVDFKAKKRI